MTPGENKLNSMHVDMYAHTITITYMCIYVGISLYVDTETACRLGHIDAS